ncbi:MAG: hypothetical protein K2N44_18105 [Lachnospiraceae bacterium]|nr:hypothetical protein [Lachnospiraceae bacterium]
MEICYYYQILDIGIVYEKGGTGGRMWKLGERKRLREELSLWREILDFVSMEEKGIDCSERLFDDMDNMCRKYNLPNYERILKLREAIAKDKCIFEINKEEETKINNLMLGLLNDAEKYLEIFMGKKMVYRILAILHNFPKVMHGNNILNRNCRSISCQNAWTYAQGYMNDKMREEYSKYLF